MKKLIRKIIPAQVLKQIRLLLQLPTLIKHKGNTYQCPICSYKSKDWYFIGSNANVYQKWQIIGGGLESVGFKVIKINNFDNKELFGINPEESIFLVTK